jgi:hypothetical protein
MDSDGDFVITWTSYQEGGFTQHALGVYAQRYSAAGIPQGGEFHVNTYTTGSQDFPTVALDDAGRITLAWESGGNQDGDNDGIYARRYELPVVPVVSTSDFRFIAAPHQLKFTFDQNVSASLGTEDLVLENLTSSTTIPAGQLSLSYDIGTNTATYTYTGPGAGISGVLPDGNYRATLLASGITNPGGIPMSANHVFNFFFLNGDANRDSRVNLVDFNVLASNFGQSPRDFTQGDFSYDGLVNLTDFNILASRFGQVLAAPDGRFGAIRIGWSTPRSVVTELDELA